MAEEKKEISGENDEKNNGMSFLEHIGELRKRLIYSLLSVIAGCIIAAVFIDDLMKYILLNPATDAGLKLQNLKPFGQPFLYFKIILIVGLILSIPYILYQIWKFIEPGLYNHEKNWARKITFFTSFCFFAGVVFSYFLMIPSMLAFAANFGAADIIINNIDVNEYLSFLTMIILAAGILFEMPVVSYILARVGILTPKFMRKYRRHSIIVILIIAAVMTPTPDPISQLIFAAPLFVLYEISILIAKIAEKSRDKKEE